MFIFRTCGFHALWLGVPTYIQDAQVLDRQGSSRQTVVLLLHSITHTYRSWLRLSNTYPVLLPAIYQYYPALFIPDP